MKKDTIVKIIITSALLGGAYLIFSSPDLNNVVAAFSKIKLPGFSKELKSKRTISEHILSFDFPESEGTPPKIELKLAEKDNDVAILNFQGHPGNLLSNYYKLLEELLLNYESYEKNKELGDRAYTLMANMFIFHNSIPSREQFIKFLDEYIPKTKLEFGQIQALQREGAEYPTEWTATIEVTEVYSYTKIPLIYKFNKRGQLFYI